MITCVKVERSGRFSVGYTSTSSSNYSWVVESYFKAFIAKANNGEIGERNSLKKKLCV